MNEPIDARTEAHFSWWQKTSAGHVNNCVYGTSDCIKALKAQIDHLNEVICMMTPDREAYEAAQDALKFNIRGK